MPSKPWSPASAVAAKGMVGGLGEGEGLRGDKMEKGQGKRYRKNPSNMQTGLGHTMLGWGTGHLSVLV